MAEKPTMRQLALIELQDELAEVDPWEADALTFGPRCLVSATLPYQQPQPESLEDGCWIRRNGRYTLWVQGGPAGIPYGAYPRLFAIWLTREAIITKERYIYTDKTFKGFCKTLGIDSSVGKRGSGRYMRSSIVRLLSSRVGFLIEEESRTRQHPIQIADEFDLWWDNKTTEETLKEGYIVLSENFFNEITRHYIPIDLRVIRNLTRSPLALDLYQWLAYRYHNMRTPASRVVTWRQLQSQFGTTFVRLRDFRRLLLKALKLVSVVYPQAKFDVTDDGLILHKSPTPIPESRTHLELVSR